MFKQAVRLGTAFMLMIPVWAHSSEHAYAIEPANTRVTFEVNQLGVAARHGVFSEVAGTVLLDTQAGEGSVEIVVDARLVNAGDAATQAFVRGKSFLNVAQHSEIVYKSDHVVFAEGKPVLVQGTLRLLGVTRAVPLTISGYRCAGEGKGCVLDAAASFRRSEFGMNRYLALVSDAVRLEIHGVTTAIPQSRTGPVTLTANR